MRPRRLRIAGFTSFRDEQEVDLRERELFVITGPTGGGKTSILDAMGLALYGKVPRMGGQGLGELVSHGQAEARVMLEFAVNGAIYRVSRRLPRRGAQSARLERLEGDDWLDAASGSGVRAVNDTVQGLVKLDFASFCKAVVLPQGEFARFLKGDPTERRTTLVALLGLGSYERMRALAGERARELQIRTQQTGEILQGEEFADATPEGLAAAEQAAATARDQAQALSTTVTTARDDDRSRTERSRRAARAGEVEERLGALGADVDVEQARCREAEVDADAARQSHAPVAQRAADAAAGLAAAEAAVAELTAKRGSVEVLTRLSSAAEGLPSLEAELASAAAVAHRLLEAESGAAATLSELRGTVADAEGAVRAAHEQRLERRREEADAAERFRSLERRAADLNAASAQLRRAEEQLDPARMAAQRVGEAAQGASRRVEEHERRLGALERQDMVAALTATLAAGDPCPVCARPLEGGSATNGHIAGELMTVRAQLTSARGAAEAATREAAAATARLDQAEAAHREALTAWQRLEPEDGGLESVERSLELARRDTQEATADRTAVEATYDRAADELGQRRQEMAAAETRAKGLAEQRAQAEQALDGARTRCEAARALLRDRFGDSVPADAAARLAADLAAIGEAVKALAAARAAEETARKTLEEAARAVDSAERRLSKIDIALQELRGRAQTALEAAHEIDPDGLVLVLPQPAAARHVRAGELAEWARAAAGELQALGSRLRSDALASAARIIDAATGHGIAADDASAALAALEQALAEALDGHGSAKQQVAAVTRRLEHRRRLEAQIAEDRVRGEVLEMLARELRSDRFIEFVIQETLDLLAAHASEELRRISDGRYSLVSADGQFSVVDHRNADEQRSVRTLSGGETFMASLALALALSRHVSDLAGEGLGARLEAVFIDEGFGSLDPETRDEVIDALERLRDAELLVGVISHVPEVAERIGEGFEVRQDGSRSVILDRLAA